ncbi:MAG: hypothetical protein AB7S72_17590 [Draconibacterium sp.]
MKPIKTLFLLFILFSCTNEVIKNDLTEKNLKGRVKSITESRYNAIEKFGEVEKDSLIDTTVFVYDEKGNSNFTDRDRYKSNDPNCKFDERGNPIEYTTTGKYINNWKYKLKWDDKNRVIEHCVFDNYGNLNLKRTFKFDDKGNKIEEGWQSASHSDPTKFTYRKHINKYDDENNLISKFIEDNIDGSLSPEETYKYDAKGNMVEEKHFSDGSIFSIKKCTYDNVGKLIETNEKTLDNSFNVRTIYKYDEKGNDIDVLYTGIFDNEPITRNYSNEYEYDKTGNWVKKVAFLNGKAEEIIEREIDYY